MTVINGEAYGNISAIFKLRISKKQAETFLMYMNTVKVLKSTNSEVRAIELFYDDITFYDSNKDECDIDSAFAVISDDTVSFRALSSSDGWLSTDSYGAIYLKEIIISEVRSL